MSRRVAAPPHDDAPPGVRFAPAPDGTRSSSAAGRRIVAAALRPLDAARADAVLAERDWRHRYPQAMRALVEGGLADGARALASAEAGLAEAWSALEFGTPAGACSLAAALDAPDGLALGHWRVAGERRDGPDPWTVPVGGRALAGTELSDRIDDWCARGIIEPGAAEALRRCQAHPEWFDLSDRRLVLMGAGSEAGPLRWLLRWRAQVLALDLPRPALWQRLAALARAGNGVLQAPLRPGAPAGGGADGAAHAGADLLSEAPAIARWLMAQDQPLDLGAFAYLDGERHVRVVLAMDMVTEALCRARTDTTLAFMATPTDVFAVPGDAARAAMARHAHRPLASRAFQGALALATGRRFFQPNVRGLLRASDGRDWGVVDALVLQQGPNYALAKRLQQWRALRARAAGHRVSLNIAPSTTTASVLKNPALSAGFAGASAVGVEVFAPATTNALMAALWVHDLRWSGAAADPTTPLGHPFALLAANACHGGLWRIAYQPRSALPFAAALGFVRQRLGLAAG